MKHVPHLLIATAVAFTAITAQAEQLQMPPPPQPQLEWKDEHSTMNKPSLGMSKRQVFGTYGAPLSENGPTGEPPIYYWDYEHFTVYFESDYVIHSVSKYKNKPLVSSEKRVD